MHELLIEQEGSGALAPSLVISSTLKQHVLPAAAPVSLQGDGFDALFQQWTGAGFTVWYSRYWMHRSVVLRAGNHHPALELRISLHNQIKGTWEQVAQPELPAYYYQLNFVPFVATRAQFDAGQEYATFDIHIEFSFLEKLGIDYPAFQQFLESVVKQQPVALLSRPGRCPPLMQEAVRAILHNSYSVAGRQRLLEHCVGQILLAALEAVEGATAIMPTLTSVQREGLHEVKRQIEQHLPDYPGNAQLCRKGGLNLFTLHVGFKRLFGMNPYDYYNLLRMERGKDLLCKGDSVSSVAYELNFSSPRAFGKAFKARFGMTPKAWRVGR